MATTNSTLIRRFALALLATAATGASTAACTGDVDSGPEPTAEAELLATAGVNHPPVVDAGPDQVITLPTTSVYISGSVSDPDGDAVTYEWGLLSYVGNYAGTLYGNPGLLSQTVTSLQPGVYVFRLFAKDSAGATASDTVQITVNEAASNPPPANQPPSVGAGGDKSLTLPVSSVTLVGSASDPDGTIASYAWSQVSGGAATLSGANTPQLSLSGLAEGSYVFRLTVTDNAGASASADAKVTVSPAATPPPPGGSGTLALHEADPSGSIGTTCGYGEYLPPGYSASGHFPFLIFLHGMGENGGTLTNAVYTANGPMHELKNGTIAMSQVPMVVLQPHLDPNCHVDLPGGIASFVQFAISHYGLDAKRFYITGLSQGGGLTVYYLEEYAKTPGEPIPAAAVPLSTNGSFKDYINVPKKLIADGVAVWAGTSANDSAYAYGGANTYDTIQSIWDQITGPSGKFSFSDYPYPGTLSTCYYSNPVTKKFAWASGMVSQVSGADINPPYLLSVFPGNSHGAPWAPMYSNPDMYRWLLSHGRP